MFTRILTQFILAFLLFLPAPQTAAQTHERASVSSEVNRIEDIRARNSTGTQPGTPREWTKKEQRLYPDMPPVIPDQEFTQEGSSRLLPESTAKAREKSPLEKMYSARIVEEVVQYGYDLFGAPQQAPLYVAHPESESPRNRGVLPSGAAQDDFVLGEGDELDIAFNGQRSDRGIYPITTQGMILIPDFPPVPAAGRTMGQFRISLEAAAKNLYNTDVYVSLASVRQIGVLVIGHVKKPGRQNLTVFHTALDALIESGGVLKTGSLRQIKLVRSGRSTLIDLYALLMNGSTNTDLQLRDGDRIIVPAIGPTAAVGGEVKRPGIYELLPQLQGMYYKPGDKSEKISLNDMLALGGGLLAPGKNRLLKLEVTADGKETVEEIQDGFAPAFGDGAVLMVSKGLEKREGMVEISGETRRPGLHALSQNPNLSSLLSSPAVLSEKTYPLIGVVERWDPEMLARTWIDFPLQLVLKGQYDRKLADGDVIHLFSKMQISALSGSESENETVAHATPSVPVSQGSREPESETSFEIEDPALAGFLKERSVFVRGAVRLPGAYPVSEGITLDAVLAAAGGLSLEASTSNVEVTSSAQGKTLTPNAAPQRTRRSLDLTKNAPQSVIIGPGDAVRVNQKFKKVSEQSVLVIGEVRNPGRYDLLPGDKMSDLLQRAGGLTDQAYPEGAIFSRDSERKAEEARYRSQARSIKHAIAEALEIESKSVDAAKIAEARALAEELDQAQGLGRITIEADPGVLAANPALDLLLEAGDRLYMPKRSLTVRVNGDVLSPASLQFREGKKPGDYIAEAGGFTFHADKDRTFVLYPDGSAQPLETSTWSYNPAFIPPGSTVVVPRDPKPFDFIESAKDISQILSNLAITAVFIDDVVNDDL